MVSALAAAVSREVAVSAVQPRGDVDHEAVEVVDDAASVAASGASGFGGSSRVSSLK